MRAARAERQQTARELWAEAVDPGERLLVWQWADANRMLSSKESAEPGYWRTDRVPYLRQPMETLSVSNLAERVIFQWGAQLGKSATVLNFLGYCIDHEPAPAMLILPTLDTAKRYSRNRVDALIESTPCLQAKVSERRSRDAANSRLLKDFPGGYLIVAGANSAAMLREASIRYLIAEEIDAYESDAGDEGDPITLAVRRTATYRGRRKILYVSTPGLEGISRIDRERRGAEQEWHFHVPCPSCGHFQALIWEQLRYEPPPPASQDGERAIPPELAGVTYECVACQASIGEFQKLRMLEQGRWVAVRDQGHRSVAFFLNALYSTLGFSWGEAAAMYEAAKDDPKLMQVFVNTVLGLPYAEPREAPPWEPLLRRREEYAIGVVQPGCRFLTMAVDVQGNRLELELRGWGRGHRSWSLLYRQLLGDPLDEPVWAELDELLRTEWPIIGSDATLPVWCCAVDSGNYPQRVYRWARGHAQPAVGAGTIAVRVPRTVMVVKGRDVWGRTLLTPEKASQEEKRRGLKVVGVGVSGLKRELYQWFRQERREDGREPHGWIHWPADPTYDDRYFKGLVAERLVVKIAGGRPREVWELPAGLRNEPLDLHVYNRAAAAACGIDRFTERDWQRLERQLPASLLRQEGAPAARGPSPEVPPRPDAERPPPVAPGPHAPTAAVPSRRFVSYADRRRSRRESW